MLVSDLYIFTKTGTNDGDSCRTYFRTIQPDGQGRSCAKLNQELGTVSKAIPRRGRLYQRGTVPPAPFNSTSLTNNRHSHSNQTGSTPSGATTTKDSCLSRKRLIQKMCFGVTPVLEVRSGNKRPIVVSAK